MPVKMHVVYVDDEVWDTAKKNTHDSHSSVSREVERFLKQLNEEFIKIGDECMHR